MEINTDHVTSFQRFVVVVIWASWQQYGNSEIIREGSVITSETLYPRSKES